MCPKFARVTGNTYRWTDWVGCLFYITIALDTLVHSPRITLLLLPAVLHELVVAASFIIRRPLNRTISGWKPRVAAYTGTFLVLGFIRLSSSINPEWTRATHSSILNAAGAISWLIGLIFGLYSVWWFRHSFSIVPQARSLVTSGPYRIARHPIYLSYLLQYLGLWMTHFTAALGVVLAIWFALMWVRINYEEQVLEQAFPEYSEYRQNVHAIYPTIPRRVIRANTSRNLSSQKHQPVVSD
jgi:protein-S-isoprenylcysteine O-methyltransferase Ste14